MPLAFSTRSFAKPATVIESRGNGMPKVTNCEVPAAMPSMGCRRTSTTPVASAAGISGLNRRGLTAVPTALAEDGAVVARAGGTMGSTRGVWRDCANTKSRGSAWIGCLPVRLEARN